MKNGNARRLQSFRGKASLRRSDAFPQGLTYWSGKRLVKAGHSEALNDWTRWRAQKCPKAEAPQDLDYLRYSDVWIGVYLHWYIHVQVWPMNLMNWLDRVLGSWSQNPVTNLQTAIANGLKKIYGNHIVFPWFSHEVWMSPVFFPLNHWHRHTFILSGRRRLVLLSPWWRAWVWGWAAEPQALTRWTS